MIRGKIQGTEFTIEFNPYHAASTDPGIVEMFDGLGCQVYDPAQGMRLAFIEDGDLDAYLVINEVATVFGLDLEITEGPDLGEEEHIKIKH